MKQTWQNVDGYWTWVIGTGGLLYSILGYIWNFLSKQFNKGKIKCFI